MDDERGGGAGAADEPSRVSGSAGVPIGEPRPVDEAAVRWAYEYGSESVAAICNRFGLKPWELTKRRIEGGWTARPQAAKAGPLRGRKPLGAASLDFRLSRLVAVGIAMLERRVADDGFEEGSARTLKELFRAAEIMKRTARTEKAARSREKKNNDARPESADDIAAMRAELLRRVAVVRAAGGRGRTDQERDG